MTAPARPPMPDTPPGVAGGSIDETALVAALRAGQPAAFERLLREQGGRMLATAMRIMGREDDAREAVQDALVSLVRGIGRFDGQSKLSTWLHRVIVNAALMRLRTRRRRPEVSIDRLLPHFDRTGHREDAGPAWNPAPESGIERERIRHAVRQAIGELPEAYQEVLVLRDLEGLDTDATAAALGVTPGAIKTRLHRARQALRTLLEPTMTDRSDGIARDGAQKGGRA